MNQDEQWRAFVAEHLKTDTEHLRAIRANLATITFVVVAGFLFGFLGVLMVLANNGSL